jgi:hypothetical protein
VRLVKKRYKLKTGETGALHHNGVNFKNKRICHRRYFKKSNIEHTLYMKILTYLKNMLTPSPHIPHIDIENLLSLTLL